MLEVETLLVQDGIAIADVACHHPRGRGRCEEVTAHAVVFLRRGCFRRRADGVEHLLDASSAYFMAPRQEQRCDHPHAGGDDCTVVFVAAELVARVWGGDPALPSTPVHTGRDLDLAHRRLLAAARRRDDPHDVTEHALALLANLLGTVDPARVGSEAPPPHRISQIVEDVRAMLVEDPSRSLIELASALTVSPHHLSRTFTSVTGLTVSRYRMRLRARAALERLAGGERNLSWLAADLGFADHSHLCRVLRAEAGQTPTALRAALSDT